MSTGSPRYIVLNPVVLEHYAHASTPARVIVMSHAISFEYTCIRGIRVRACMRGSETLPPQVRGDGKSSYLGTNSLSGRAPDLDSNSNSTNDDDDRYPQRVM